jgi:hypothetical protein
MNGIANPKVAFKVYTHLEICMIATFKQFSSLKKSEALGKSSLWEY